MHLFIWEVGWCLLGYNHISFRYLFLLQVLLHRLSPKSCFCKSFIPFTRGLWSESQNFWRPQNLIWPLFLKAFLRLFQYFHFYLSYVPIFLLTDSAEFRQCFTYAKHTSPTIFCWARGLWSESFRLKTSESQNCRRPQNSDFHSFLNRNFHFKAI